MKMSYSWIMPNPQTFKAKPINAFILEHLPEGLVIDPFANRASDYGAITNDLNPEADTDFHLDALDFLKTFDDRSVDGVLFDPPYSLRQVKECYESYGLAISHHQTKHYFSDIRNEIARIVKPSGVVLSFGWNSVGIGKSRGFEKEALLLCCHGGNHHDTICLMEVLNTGEPIGQDKED